MHKPARPAAPGRHRCKHWTDSIENARNMAAGLRKAGYYSVQVWAHSKDGARMTDL